MLLTALPIELIEAIGAFTVPDSFSEFALTCKTVYAACSHLRSTEYNQRRLKYRYASSEATLTKGQPFVELLRDIIEDPDVGRYVHHLDLSKKGIFRHHGDDSTYDDLLPELKTFLQATSPVPTDVKKATLDAMDFLEQKEWQQTMLFSSRAERGRSWEDWPTIPTMILFCLLPNLKTLKLPGSNWEDLSSDYENGDEPDLWSILNPLILHMHNSTSSSDRLPRNLKRITARDMQTIDLLPLLIFPGVEEVFAHRLDFYPGPLELKCPDIGDIKSNIRLLELVKCGMSDYEAEDLFCNMPHLRVLRCDMDVDFTRWNAGTFVSSIGRHVGDRLEELTFTITRNEIPSERGHGLSSMKEFTALKTLEIDINAFYAVTPNWDNQFEEPFGRDPIPPLAEILPPNIETIGLCVMNDFATIMQYLRDDHPQGTILRELFDMSPEQQARLKECYLTVRHNKTDGINAFEAESTASEKKDKIPISHLIESAGGKILMAEHAGWLDHLYGLTW